MDHEEQGKVDDEIENKRLTQEQSHLYRQVFYSYNEEVDLFFCTKMESELVEKASLTETKLDD